MNVLKNPESRKAFVLHLAITLIFSAVCAFFSVFAAVAVAVLSLVLLAVHMRQSKRLYDEIADLCDDIDRVLMGSDSIDFAFMSEGDLGILRSELHKMTIRLREQNSNLADEKNFMKDALSDVSHQLRTPLTSMNLIVSMLCSRELSAQERGAYLKDLTELLSRTQWLIETLLKISQLDAGAIEMKPTSGSCRELIKEALAPMEISAELKELSIVTDIGEGCTFTGDFRWCREALSNILKNCIEHTPCGGSIHIAAEENTICTRIVITDSGEGIPEKDLPHIFDRFYRCDLTKQGYGLGLALAKQIVSEQDGMLRVSNGKNGGAEFEMRLYRSVV